MKRSVGFVKSNRVLYSRDYVKARNKWRGLSPLFSARAAQLRRNVAAVASRWRHFVRCDQPGNRTRDLPHGRRCA